MSLGTEVGLGPGHIVLDGDSAPPERGAAASPLSAHVYCDQTVGMLPLYHIHCLSYHVLEESSSCRVLSIASGYGNAEN